MSATIPGGAYLVDGAWVDAEGKRLDKDRVAEAERVAAEQQAQRDEQERQRMVLEAQSNPLSRVLAGFIPQQQPQRAAEPAPKREAR